MMLRTSSISLILFWSSTWGENEQVAAASFQSGVDAALPDIIRSFANAATVMHAVHAADLEGLY